MMAYLSLFPYKLWWSAKQWQLQSLSSKPWLVFTPSALDLSSNSRVKAHANACILVRVSPSNTATLCWAQLFFSILNLNHSQNFFATLWPSCCPRTSEDWSSSQFPPCTQMGYSRPRVVVAERRASVAAEAGCLGLPDANGFLSEGPALVFSSCSERVDRWDRIIWNSPPDEFWERFVLTPAGPQKSQGARR